MQIHSHDDLNCHKNSKYCIGGIYYESQKFAISNTLAKIKASTQFWIHTSYMYFVDTIIEICGHNYWDLWICLLSVKSFVVQWFLLTINSCYTRVHFVYRICNGEKLVNNWIYCYIDWAQNLRSFGIPIFFSDNCWIFKYALRYHHI